MSQESKEDLIVYGKPGCVQCKFTTNELDKLAIPYQYKDVTQDPHAFNVVAATGHTTLPMVAANGIEPWFGFSPDKIRGLDAR